MYRHKKARRLIPAHAGKTANGHPFCALARAHPRSRGENDSGYQPEQVAEVKILPLGKLEKLVGKSDLPDLIGDYITKREGKPSLVGEADPRPPLTAASSAAADFG